MYNESVQIVILLSILEYVSKRNKPYTLGDIIQGQIINNRIEEIVIGMVGNS